MPEYNARESREKNTLVLTEVEQADGSFVDWVVPPFSKDTEEAYWAWSKEVEDKTAGNKAASRENKPFDPVTKGWVWSRLLALAVKKVRVGEEKAESPTTLVAEQLERDLDSLTLEDLGTAVEVFFLKRRVKGEPSNRPLVPPAPPTPESTTSSSTGA